MTSGRSPRHHQVAAISPWILITVHRQQLSHACNISDCSCKQYNRNKVATAHDSQLIMKFATVRVETTSERSGQTKGHQLRPHALRSARHRETHAFRNFSVDAAAVVVPARRGPKVHYYRYGFRRASESSTTRQPAQLVYLSCVSSALAARGRRRLSATCSLCTKTR